MKFNEKNKIKAFIYANEQIYVDDTHYGACIQLMIDCEVKTDDDFENIDEYEEINNIDKNAIFGEFHKVNKRIYPIAFSNIHNEKFINEMIKGFNYLFMVDENDNLIRVK